MEIASSVSRVAEHTADEVNEVIRNKTKESIRAHRDSSSTEIERRLKELDREWDIERTIQANAASLSLTGVGLAAFVDKRWLVLSGAVAGFLLQHAIQGWCPPVPVLRRLGFRTPQEIEEERYALKLIRGDFESFSGKRKANVEVDEIYQKVSR